MNLRWLCALPLMAMAYSAQALDIATLCRMGIEGSAISNIEGLGPTRMNLICLDDERIGGTADIKDTMSAGLPFSIVDSGVRLAVAQFPMTHDALSGVSSLTSLTYSEISIDSIIKGNIKGFFLNGNLTRPINFDAKLDQTFPPLSSFPSHPIDDPLKVAGTYALTVDRGGVKANAEIWIHVVGDKEKGYSMLTNMRVGTEQATPMIDGPLWDGSGRFKVTTAMGDTVSTGRKIWSIRGYFLDENTAMIYWINPMYGITGPYKAVKVYVPDILQPHK